MFFKKAWVKEILQFRTSNTIFEDLLYTLKQASEITWKHRDTLTYNNKSGRLKIVRDATNKPLILWIDLINFISVK